MTKFPEKSEIFCHAIFIVGVIQLLPESETHNWVIFRILSESSKGVNDMERAEKPGRTHPQQLLLFY